MSHDDFAAEIDPALPGQLPRGERIIWQGKPDWRNLTWRVYHLREVALYFAVLMLWRAFSAWWETGLLIQAAVAVMPLLVPVALCAMILTLIGWLSARTSQYTLTDRRLVLKIGVALPTTFNLPFSTIGSAELRETGRGCGDIGVSLSSDDKLAYLMLWPHARPWKLVKPEPMLRSVPDAVNVAGLLSSALRAAAGQSSLANGGYVPQDSGRQAPASSDTGPRNVVQMNAMTTASY